MSSNTPAAALARALATIGVAGAADRTDLDDPTLTFADLDVDSLGVMEVAACLEADCGLVIADEDLSDIAGPAGLLALLDDLSASTAAVA